MGSSLKYSQPYPYLAGKLEDGYFRKLSPYVVEYDADELYCQRQVMSQEELTEAKVLPPIDICVETWKNRFQFLALKPHSFMIPIFFHVKEV